MEVIMIQFLLDNNWLEFLVMYCRLPGIEHMDQDAVESEHSISYSKREVDFLLKVDASDPYTLLSELAQDRTGTHFT